MSARIRVGILTLVFICIGSFSLRALAQAPESLSFQGQLTDSTGALIDTSVTMTFRLYKGSAEIWSQTIPSVSVTSGHFGVILGGTGAEALDTVAFNQPMDIGVTVGDEKEMKPRTPMVSGAFALGLRGLYVVDAVNGTSRAPNLVAGASNNVVAAGTVGNTVSGGGGIVLGSDKPNVITGAWGTIGGGFGNLVGLSTGAIGGGVDNTTSGVSATIGGGIGNSVSGARGTIGGGSSNTASGVEATIGGGQSNQATAGQATISGGKLNSATETFASIGGGLGNVSSGTYSVVAGGQSDTASAFGAVVSGGTGNLASGSRAVVGGGFSNKATNLSSVISGGGSNISSNEYSTVGGGSQNEAHGLHSTIGGGHESTIASLANYSVVAGGRLNNISDDGEHTAISGGGLNEASGAYANIGGGFGNSVTGNYASVGGGRRNSAEGPHSVVAGGYSNATRGNSAFAAGALAQAIHFGSFVWNGIQASALPSDTLSSTGDFQFLIRAQGGVGIGTNEPAGDVHISSGASGDAILVLEADSSNTDESDNPMIQLRQDGGVIGVNIGFDETNFGSNRFGIGRRTLDGDFWDTFVIDGTGYIGMGTNSPGFPLQVGTGSGAGNGNGAHVTTGGIWTDASSKTFKTNVIDIDRYDILRKLADLPISSWEYTNADDGLHIGPMAEEFYDAFGLGNDDRYISGSDARGVSMAAIQALFELVQTQQDIIEEQGERIAKLEGHLAD